jgi:hypothetical protein
VATATKTKPREIEQAGTDWPYRFAVLPLDSLFVDEEYQRPLTSFVRRIEQNYDPALIQCLVVSDRENGTYAIIDGQTRKVGAQRNDVAALPCLVYLGLTQAQEAVLFAKFQTERRGMTSATRFRAQVIGKDVHAGIIDALVRDEGYHIDHNDTTGEGNNIRAIGAVEYVFWGCSATKKERSDMSKAEPELLKRTLRVIRAAWPPPHPTATSATIIRGIGSFLKSDPDADDERLVARLKKMQPSELARRADQLREGRGLEGNSPLYLAEAVASEYKRRGRS